MTTRLQLRTSLRERLEDTGAAPLWTDAALNDWLGQAVALYGVQVPAQATAATGAITGGATSVALPGGVEAEGVVAVRNVAGETVSRFDDKATGAAPLDSRGLAQGWVAWGTMLRFRRPIVGSAEIGVWSIDHAGGRVLVADDVTSQPIVVGDEPIIVTLATAMAMDRRAAEYGKRGDDDASKEMRAVAAAMRAEADAMIGARRRRPRSGFLHGDGE